MAAQRATLLLLPLRRPWGVAGRWGAMVREGLEELLPEDCHARCAVPRCAALDPAQPAPLP